MSILNRLMFIVLLMLALWGAYHVGGAVQWCIDWGDYSPGCRLLRDRDLTVFTE